MAPLGRMVCVFRQPAIEAGYHIIASVTKRVTIQGAPQWVRSPAVWWHCAGKGHALYSALGTRFMYAEPMMIPVPG